MNDEELQSIERQIRAWTARPPARSPRLARTRVLARIGERRARPRWHLLAAAALVAALAVGLPFLAPERPSGPPPAVASLEQPGPGLLVYELRSGTKLYLALAAREPTAGTRTH